MVRKRKKKKKRLFCGRRISPYNLGELRNPCRSIGDPYDLSKERKEHRHGK